MTWPLAARKEVADRLGRCSFAPVMTFTGEGLVLGGAILAPPHRDRGATEIAIDGTEERILALLAVAYRKTTGPGVLGNIRRAARYWRRGETTSPQSRSRSAACLPWRTKKRLPPACCWVSSSWPRASARAS